MLPTNDTRGEKMMKIKMLISVSRVAALSAACGLDNDSLTLEERAEIAGATDLHIELPESLPEAGPNQPTCGGFLGAVCPVGMQCIDYPGDGCNPNQGGADCLGMCVGTLLLTSYCGDARSGNCRLRWHEPCHHWRMRCVDLSTSRMSLIQPR